MTKHILVVDDEEILLEFLVAQMRNDGYRVTALERGGEIMGTLAQDPGVIASGAQCIVACGRGRGTTGQPTTERRSRRNRHHN